MAQLQSMFVELGWHVNDLDDDKIVSINRINPWSLDLSEQQNKEKLEWFLVTYEKFLANGTELGEKDFQMPPPDPEC